MIFRTFIIVAALCIATQGMAGGYCYQPSYVQREIVHEYPQTIVEHQNVFYSVGQDVRQYAVAPQAVVQAQAGEVERQIARLQDRLAEYRQQTSPQPQYSSQVVYCMPLPVQAAYCPPAQSPLTQPVSRPQFSAQPQPAAPNGNVVPPKLSETVSVVQAACMKCHGANKVEADLDFTRALTCEQKQKAITKAALGEMPKNGPKLTPEQFVELTKEIAALRTVGNAPAEPKPAEN